MKATIIEIACPSEPEAKSIGEILLDKKLVAAFQIDPIFSMYCWEDKKEKGSEWMLRLITRAENFQAIEEIVNKEHS